MSQSRSALGMRSVIGLLAGPFLSMMDANVVNVAVPDIARVLKAPLESVQWTVSGYLLALATGLAASAFLERRFGGRRVYLASLAAFVVSSVACAFAPTLPMLVGARILQGLSGAPLVPVAMGMLLGPTRRQIPAAAGVLLFLAPAAGPTLGGVLITAFGWPSIFLINVPVGLAGLVGTLHLDRRLSRPPQPRATLDAPGLLLLAAGLGLAVYGSGQAPAAGWWSAAAAPYWISGSVLLGSYVVWARRRSNPVLRLGLLHDGQAALALSLATLASIVLFAVLFLIPVFLQTAQHASAFAAGLVLLPQGAAMGLSMVLSDRVTRNGGLRETVMGGMGILTLTTAAMLFIVDASPNWLIAIILTGRGLALGFIIQPLLARMLCRVEPADLADANAVFNITQRLAGSFSIALLASAYVVMGFHATVAVLLALALAALAGSPFTRNPVASASAGGVDSGVGSPADTKRSPMTPSSAHEGLSADAA